MKYIIKRSLPGVALFLLFTGAGSLFAQTPAGYPDNVSDAECFGVPEATTWSMREAPINKTKLIHNYMPLLSGDIDGDGIVEIVGAIPDTNPTNGNYSSTGIRMFTYNGTQVIFKKDISFTGHLVATYGSMAMARYNGIGYIVAFGSVDKCLHAYNAATGAHIWKSVDTGINTVFTYINIADFNSDGIPEVYTGNRIFSLPTGALLCSGGNNNKGVVDYSSTTSATSYGGSFSIAADVTGDGKLDLCAGRQVYKVNIPANATTAGTGTMTVDMQLASVPANAAPDGITTVADMDNDGQMEVVVTSLAAIPPDTPRRAVVYVWKPNPGGTPALLGSYLVPPTSVGNTAIPMIGNIDGDIYPEIVFITNGTPLNMYALDYNPGGVMGSRLVQKWTLTHTDASGCTGMSLFDFNLDGVNEIVYRDQTSLRIINGNASPPNVLATLTNVSSGTLRELPVVADLDADGRAEIVVTGYDGASPAPVVDGISANTQNGYLRVFETNGSPWAPARKVWNQYGYNAINVNNDLTIPKSQFSPATAFPGEDPGTADDIRPYNNFMTQQTLLSTDGTPFWPLPDLALSTEAEPPLEYKYYNAGDSLSLVAHVTNKGDAALVAPVCFAVYKDAALSANKIGTGVYSEDILPGETVVIRTRIDDFLKNYPDAEDIVIRLNDNGITFPMQKVCSDNSQMSTTMDMIAAIADEATTLKDDPVNIAILANDTLGDCDTPAITIVSPSANGTATVNGQQVTFTPNAGYVGTTTFTYQIACDGQIATAVVTVKVLGEWPDNISDADCFITPAAYEWGMKETRSTAENLSPYISTMVGDVDNDGIPEILASMDPVNSTVNGISRPSSGIAIFKGNDITVPWKTITTTQPYSWNHMTKFGIIKTQIAKKDTVLVVVAESDRYLRAYNYNGGLVWTSNTVYHSTASSVGWDSAAPGFADFNKDGIPEVMVKGKIFNSVDGQLLCATPDPAFGNYVPIAADLFNTGNLNFIVGNKIYTPNASLTALTLERTITLPVNPADPDIPAALGARPVFPDGGFASAVDMDKDGKLELIYQIDRGSLSQPYAGESLICIVDPSTGAVKASKYIPYAPSSSWPFVGDIDGCGFPEIVFITTRRNTAPPNATEQPYWNMHAYKFIPGNPLLQKFWTYPHQDASGLTGMTLFDFNQDGISEIVYRDEQEMRIINGSLKNHETGLPVTAPYNLTSVSGNTSGTSAEYPVVADVNADGQAEIIIVGGTAPRATLGSLRVYKTGNDSPWAPARKVWNQYAYNVVNVNEDLTVPQTPLSPATVFAGTDGVLGTDDDTRPFNNFLQQQTSLSKWGTPLWLAPNVVWDTDVTPALDYHYYNAGDSLVVTAHLENIGDAAIGAPVYIAVYKESASTANLLGVGTYQGQIQPSDTGSIRLSIHDFLKDHSGMSKIVVRINDNGVKFPYQEVCRNDSPIEMDMIAAIADEATTLKDDPVNIAILANDTLGDCDTPAITIVSPSANGTATVNGQQVTFTPNTGYVGTTTFTYQMVCDGQIATAVVTVKVLGEWPDNIGGADCFVLPPAFEWTIAENWHSTQTNVSTYLTPVVGDLDGDGLSEIVVGTWGNINDTNYRPSPNILVYKGSDRTTPITIDVTGAEGNFLQAGTVAIARVPIGTDTVPLIVMIDKAGYLRAYNPFSKNGANLTVDEYVWKSNDIITTPYTNTNRFGAVSFADFNADGIPEIYVGNRIFNAATGVMLVDGSVSVGTKGAAITASAGTYQYLPAVADIDGDSQLEYVAGTYIYKVDIANKNNASGNEFKLVSQMTPLDMGGGTTISEGWTILADINKDGRLDAIVVSHTSSTSYTISIWDIYAKIWLGTITDNTYMSYYGGIPFVGDIDADGNLEIVQTAGQSASTGWLRGYRWDGVSSLTRVYQTSTSDVSGSTGMTLFDFNQDKVPELVYRDQTDLRILQAMPDGTFLDRLPVRGNATLAQIPAELIPIVGSGTYIEYPVVADVDSDGAAEIVVVGGPANNAAQGTVRIYKSATTPWAPARKVWNQYAYNAVNVNEDLTIPKYPINTATAFPGEDGVLGSADDVQTFNNFLQQQTTLSKWGTPLWLAPNGQIVDTPSFTYNETANTMTVSVQVTNTGDAAFQSPFHVTLYKDAIDEDNLKFIHSYEDNAIGIGDTVTISFTVPDFSETGGWIEHSALFLKINDNGNGQNEQAVCDDSNSRYEYHGLISSVQDVCLGEATAIECLFELSPGDTYQWSRSSDKVTWTLITGATGKAYQPADNRQGTTYYRVTVTGDASVGNKVVSSDDVANIRVRSCFLPVNPHIRGRMR